MGSGDTAIYSLSVFVVDTDKLFTKQLKQELHVKSSANM